MLILEEKTFLSCDKFPAQGVNYHLVGVFLEELKPFLPVNGEVIEVLLKPFVTVLGRSLDKVLLSKIKGCVFGVLLENGEKLLERKRKGEEGVEGGGVDEVELFGSIASMLGFSKKFFELGSSEECVQGNRKVLFGLHEEFGKLEKDLACSGIEIKVPEVRNEEVSELVPVTQVDVSMDEVSEQQVEVGDKVSIGSTSKLSKKMKKLKKSSGGSVTKKSKKSKKKRDMASSSDHSEVKDGSENGNMLNGENSTDDGGLITLNAAVISNLQMQFEKVAAEVGMDTDDSFAFDLPETPLVASVPKKRKRAKSIGGQVSVCDDLIGQDVNGGSAFGKTAEKSGKKVKFAMKDNLVWKPQSPLPPQSLRLPPSATPRGSALKKGVPAGPVIETPTMVKKVKRRATSLKKARKSLKSVSPSVKRLRKRRALSA
ncbi:hypothetical protein IFM89_029061 [Coptis chinensis]|uniref:Uncharacterized protein n=1 Tax=Coptis chinensis TaxID=261450 RepID=A0A835M272_9MAGN|nr:hypothetical protein IFM89_029061 [Coptis chinensis]